MMTSGLQREPTTQEKMRLSEFKANFDEKFGMDFFVEALLVFVFDGVADIFQPKKKETDICSFFLAIIQTMVSLFVQLSFWWFLEEVYLYFSFYFTISSRMAILVPSLTL